MQIEILLLRNRSPVSLVFSIMKNTAHFLFALVALLAIAGLALMPWWTVDDAYISYRYGVNLAENGELTWNVGDIPIEGYTGILLPLLAALCKVLGLEIVMTIKLLGVLVFVFTILLIRSSMMRLGVRPWIQAGICLLYVVSPIVYVHALSGLETSIYIFLILSVTWMHIRLICDGINGYKSILYALMVLLLALTRPEGVLFALLSVFFLLWQHLKARKGKYLQFVLAVGILFVVPAVIYFVWRLEYYGYLLPNSFSAKRSSAWVNPESVKAFGRFVAYYAVIPFSIGLGLALLGIDRIQAERKAKLHYFNGAAFRSFLGLSTAFTLICLLVYFRSELFMNYASRFFIPFLPLILITTGGMLEVAWDTFQDSRASHPLRHRYTIVLIGGLLLLQLGIQTFKWRSEYAFLNYYQAIVEEEYKPAAAYLKAALPSDATIITYMDAGAIPFYTGFRTIDFGRLNDLFLARELPEEEAVIDYFFAQNANALVMTSESTENYFYIDEAIKIQNDSRFSKYEVAVVYGNSIGFPYAQWIFMKK